MAGRQATRRTGRRVWVDKTEVLTAGAAVEALDYSRASADKKREQYSVSEQAALNREQIARHGWRQGASFVDNDRSASRYATKQREDFGRLVTAIESGRSDVLVVWELNRSQRDLEVYVRLRDLCLASGLHFWLVGGSLYDLRSTADRMALGMQAVQGEHQADYIRDNVKRGIDGAARNGRPHAHVAYGYRREYHPDTGAFVQQVFDTTTRTTPRGDGSGEVYTAYGIVVSIFEQVARLVPLSVIVADLNGRGVPSPRGKAWTRQVVRAMATNPVYAGKRVLRGEVVGDGQWEALIESDVWWTVQRIVSAPDRTTSPSKPRPGAARWLLSFVAKAECGGWLAVQARKPRKRRPGTDDDPSNNPDTGSGTGSGAAGGRVRHLYVCSVDRCVAVTVEHLDAFVEAALVAWLSRPEVFEHVTESGRRDDAAIVAAQAQIGQVKADLDALPGRVLAGEISYQLAGQIETGLTQQLADLQAAVQTASVPPILHGLIGAHAAQAWADLDTPDNPGSLAARRDIIRHVCAPVVHTAHKNPRTPLAERVRWGGLMSGS